MKDSDKKLNVVPGIAAAALLLGVAALVTGIAAIARTGDEAAATSAMGSMSSGSMSAAAMDHMQPVSTKGIGRPPADEGSTRLDGVRRDGALEFELDARPVWWRIFGDRKLVAWAYNGIVPGPLIRVPNGERVRIRFTNRLPEETTIHWHGIGVPNSQDGVPGVTQAAIRPGQTYTYEFTARPAGDPDGGGTFLYHSHVDEDQQMSVGLYGAFIIDPPRPASRPDVDRTLLFSEWSADATTGRTRGVMQMEGMLPNFFTINGRSYPDTQPIPVRAGKRVLLRLVNAGQFAHPLHLHGTAFRVVARDGHGVPRALRELRDTITLESAERADIEFTLPKGKWLLHCHIGHHLTNDGEGPGGLLAVINAT